ncbi:MAG: ribonuclease III [Acidobacteria bacterium]|nr:ribonuclease III [Acidobacteriota bacterium]
MTNEESPGEVEGQNVPPAPDPRQLEENIGYTFRDRHLLERALTHRSWAHESVGAGGEREARALHNEALEFVGDSVLGLVVADALFRSHPEVTEGELSRMKHRLVSTQTLARVARRLSLGEHLRVGRGEEKTGGRRKRALLADAFEALLAAVFLDGGYAEAEGFVRRALGSELEEATPESAAAADFKTLLQERLQSERHLSPTYELVETEGPPHARTFHVEAVFDGERVRGQGCTIKAAEMDAACRALELIGPPEGKDEEVKGDENDGPDGGE